MEDVKEGIGGANVETYAGTTKSGLVWTAEVVAAEGTDEKPALVAAKTEACASSRPEDKDEPGPPPSLAAISKLVAKLAAGVTCRFKAFSAANVCLTALTTEAKKAGKRLIRTRRLGCCWWFR